jgi:quercetin dioxygenase-like cupin family protein
MRKFLCGVAAIALWSAGLAAAQQAGFARIALQTQDVCTPGKIAVQARGEFDPGFATGRHTHPGEELTYILEGQIELRIDGQPPRVVKAGETFFVPAGLVHEGINTGGGKAKVLATYIVERGQPLAPPAK